MLAPAFLVLTLWWPTCARAGENGATEPPPASAPAGEVAAEVAAAVRLYQAGDSDGARQGLLVVLSRGPELPTAVRHKALAWLGEILLAAQGPAAARSSFEALLGEDATYSLDPFEHSPEACAAFEQARAQWLTRQTVVPPDKPPEVTPAPPTRWPAGVLVPGGYRYFATRRPVPGLLVGALQVAGTTVSAVTASQLIQMQESYVSTDTAAAARWRRLSAINITAGAVAWGAYLTPVVFETVRWGRGPEVAVGVGPGAVELRGAF